MNCPKCEDVNLETSDRKGVEIDYCPGCRGVWLDRGELDKIIDRTRGYRDDDYDDYEFRNDLSDSKSRKKRTKKPLDYIKEIFDFE